LVFAVWGIDLMLAAIPTEIPSWIRFDFDWRTFTFALCLGLLSSMLFGLVPALQISRPHLVDVLKEGGRAGSGGKSQRMRNSLVVAEVALAIILLIGAGLMMRSFQVLQRTNIGADPSNTLTFRVGLPDTLFPDIEVARKFFNELMPKLEALPGVESAGATSALPASGNIGTNAVILDGEPEPKQLQDARLMRTVTITPGFLRTAHIELLRGREITEADRKDSPAVVMIDEEAARLWFPNQDPIGHQLRDLSPSSAHPWATIVGVVKPVIYDRIVRNRVLPVAYVAHSQDPERYLSIALRTKTNPKSLVSAARAAVQSVHKDVPIYRIFTMDEVVAESFWQAGFFSSLFTTFAGLALFLASLGLYGVMDYNVRQRTQEIGVRMALGAQAADVLRMITGHGLRLIGIGLVIGIIGAFFLMQLLASSLHGISAHDPVSFIFVPLILFAVGLLACYMPARAAMRLNPTEALRYE
jgi:putative ABC transport system permease protein